MPWKGGTTGSKKAEGEMANCNVVWLWFSEKYPDTGMMSKMVMKVQSVESWLRSRFPKCLLISFELLKFLAQSTAITTVIDSNTLSGVTSGQ